MLIYHPIHDVNHCVYRILLVLENSQHKEIQLELFRIIDFYHLFPHLISEIKPFPSELAGFRKVIKRIPQPYELINNAKRTMHELEAIQTTALQNLMAKNLIEIDSYKSKLIKRTEELLPESISNKLHKAVVVQEEWFRMLINEFPTINFLGKSGLKARSGLMEFRYDVEAL